MMYGWDVEHSLALALSLLCGLCVTWFAVVVIDAVRERLNRSRQLRRRDWRGIGSEEES